MAALHILTVTSTCSSTQKLTNVLPVQYVDVEEKNFHINNINNNTYLRLLNDAKNSLSLLVFHYNLIC